jgi:imidazolonepropionase-like amidohydrolase
VIVATGLDRQVALRAVTLEAAEVLGLAARSSAAWRSARTPT